MTKIFIFLLFASLNSYSLVNMDTRAYSQEWSDLKEFIDTRTYKSNKQGVFGKNWCSVLDLKSECSFKKMSKKEISVLNLKFKINKNQVSQFSINDLVYENNQVSQILSKDIVLASFTYDKSGMLVSVKNEWGTQFQYEYSISGDLVKTIFPDKTESKIIYQGDEVISFIDRHGCIENYTYESSVNYSKSIVVKKCENKVVNNSVYEFWRESKELQKIKTTVNGVSKYMFYNKNKTISKIFENYKLIEFDYFPNGLLKLSTEGSIQDSYSYNKNNKVSQIKKVNSKSNEVEETKFEYVNDNISEVRLSSGTRLKLDYDVKKRIVSVDVKGGKTLKIDYNETLDKPSYAELKGVGSIFIKYNKIGEILDVQSPQGKEVGFAIAKSLDFFLSSVHIASQINDLNKPIL
jgi:hypothetical protein